MGDSGNYVELLACALRRLGCEVKRGVSVQGVSGLVQTFALEVSRSGRSLLLCVASDESSLLTCIAKAIDVKRHRVVTVINGDIGAEGDRPRVSVIRLSSPEGVEKAARRIAEILGFTEGELVVEGKDPLHG